jgi:hypothetical protein
MHSSSSNRNLKGKTEPPTEHGGSFRERISALSNEAQSRSATVGSVGSENDARSSSGSRVDSRISLTVGNFPVFFYPSTDDGSDQLHQNSTDGSYAHPRQESRGGSSRASQNTFIEEEVQEGLEAREGSDTGSFRGSQGRRHTVIDPKLQEDPAMSPPDAALASPKQGGSHARTARRSKELLKKRSGGVDWAREMRKKGSWKGLFTGKGKKGDPDQPEGSSRSK